MQSVSKVPTCTPCCTQREVPGQENELETVPPTGDDSLVNGQNEGHEGTAKPAVVVEEDGYDTDLEIEGSIS